MQVRNYENLILIIFYSSSFMCLWEITACGDSNTLYKLYEDRIAYLVYCKQ